MDRRPIALSIAALLGLGCTSNAEPASAPTKGESPSSVQPAADTEPGTITHGGQSCADASTLTCAEGLSDGCQLKDTAGAPLTVIHVCVPAEETAGPPCEQEIAKVCGPNLTDACLLDPSPAKVHVCVSTI